MIADWQLELLKRALVNQIRPEQADWLVKHKNLPQEAIMQYVLSPEGSQTAQRILDVLMNDVDAMFRRVEQIQAAQAALGAQTHAPAPTPAPAAAQPAEAPPAVEVAPRVAPELKMPTAADLEAAAAYTLRQPLPNTAKH